MTESSNHYAGKELNPYLTKLGLHTDPFPKEIHDEFFMLDAQRSQHINMLYHLAQNSELLLVVTGEPGSGKTSLLQHFIDMGDDTWRSCVVDANSMMNPEQLLIQIAEGFGLPQDSVNFGSGIEMLKRRLVDMKRSELISILIIDDAHELPAASLTMLMKLSELSDENEGLLRIVLFSEPQLIEVLNASSLKDVRYRVTHTLEMPKLNEQETVDYIQHRLVVAGLNDTNVFTRNQLKKIYRLSGGIPGKINFYAHETLLGNQDKFSVKTNTESSTRLRSAISILVILGITLGITWFFTRDALDKLSQHLTAPDNTEHDAVTEAQQTTRPLPLMPAKPIIPSVKVGVDNTPVITNNETTENNKTDHSVNTYALRQADIQTKPITSIDKVLPSTMPIAPTTTVPAAIKTDKSILDNKSVALKKPVITKPVAPDWIARQNPRHFTLQIMGSHEHASIVKIINAHKLSTNEAAVLHTRLNNKDWFILVYGSYNTREKARASVSSLPGDLQITKPWPRQIGDIKQVK